MTCTHPYMLRRSDCYYFRIKVPPDLRPTIGQIEFTRSLKTAERARALPLALQLAAMAKHLFHALRHSKMSSGELRQVLERAKTKLKIDELREAHEREIEDLHEYRIRELRVAKLQAENDALRLAIGTQRPAVTPSPLAVPEPAVCPAAPHLASGESLAQPAIAESKTKPITMGKVIDEYLADYPRTKQPAMFKKLQPALMLLRSCIGNKPVADLRQADINGFFAIVARLPPRWQSECERRGIDFIRLANLEHPLTLGPKTFKDNYVVPVKLLLKRGRRDWQDQGFPTTLTTDDIEYKGNREKGENKQRAFTTPELTRMFHSAELQQFRVDPVQAHKWWLPMIGLYTGARVNEICQLNPQCDILQDPDSGIHYFWITNSTESDTRIRKSVKNKVSRRKVPIHSQLIKYGVLEYIAQRRETGSKLIFEEWDPTNDRASTQAEKYFRELLKSHGLRDDTPFAKITGMHAFRFTLLTRARNSIPPIDAGPITGHSGDVGRNQGGYEGELTLVNKQTLLEAIDFRFDPVPDAPGQTLDIPTL